jgi:ribosomal protein S18 acetylase RimI-like enzyme
MRIRLARNEECHLLPEIERSSGRLFADAGMHDVAGEEPPEGHVWEPHCESETLWLAVDETEHPLGFLASGVQDDVLFIYELSVAYDHQRQGIGRALLATAENKAAALGLDAVFLTTFCDVPWNGPYYTGLGYRVVEDDDLPAQLQPVMEAERAKWTHPDRRRCAMAKAIR